MIQGGPGADLIDAADGADRVGSGPGRDAVLARDGARDAIACGRGKDVAVADGLDALARRAQRCERADRGGGARRGEALLRPVCRLGVRLPGASRVLPLEQTFSIPRGTQVAANRCAATLSAGRRAPRARANGGRFVLLRAGTRRKALTLGLAGAFVQHYDTDELDASLLLLLPVGFLPPDDERVRATVLAIADEADSRRPRIALPRGDD